MNKLIGSKMLPSRNNEYAAPKERRASNRCRRLLGVFMLGFILALPVGAEVVSYTDSWDDGSTSFTPGQMGTGYWEVATLLHDVFDTANPNAGVFNETYAEIFQVQGQGTQQVDFTFLYDDGGYYFQFGYFVVTAELMAMSTETIQDKEAWAYAALQNAQVVFVDREYGEPDGYWDPQVTWVPGHGGWWSTENGGYWDHNGNCVGCTWIENGHWEGAWIETPAVGAPDGAQVAIADPDGNVIPGQEDFTYSGLRTNANTVSVELEGGTNLGFFIIPDNTLENFLADYSSNGQFNQFGVNQSGGNDRIMGGGPNWPLFSISAANPGLDPGNTGTSITHGAPDQVMAFEGTTKDGWLTDNDTGINLPGQDGTFVTFEDLWRRPNPDPNPDNWWLRSDDDFSDISFFVGNVSGTNFVPVPEPSTWIAAASLFLAVGFHYARRRMRIRSK